MNGNFELMIYLPDQDVNVSNYAISHPNLKSATCVKRNIRLGDPVVFYDLEMDTTASVEDLLSDLSVTHPEYEVVSDDIYGDLFVLKAKAYRQKKHFLSECLTRYLLSIRL